MLYFDKVGVAEARDGWKKRMVQIDTAQAEISRLGRVQAHFFNLNEAGLQTQLDANVQSTWEKKKS